MHAGQLAVFDNDILGGLALAHGFHATTGFERDGVVARTDVAILHGDFGAGIYVQAIAIGAGAADVEIFDHHVGAKHRMNAPDVGTHRGIVLVGEAFEGDIVAIYQFDSDRGAGVAQRPEGGSGGKAARADNRDVVRVVGVNHAAMDLGVRAFKATGNDREVIYIGRFDDKDVFFEVQGGVRVQFDAADEIIAGGNIYFAATGFATGVEGFLECGGVLGLVVAECAEGADVELGGGVGSLNRHAYSHG